MLGMAVDWALGFMIDDNPMVIQGYLGLLKVIFSTNILAGFLSLILSLEETVQESS